VRHRAWNPSEPAPADLLSKRKTARASGRFPRTPALERKGLPYVPVPSPSRSPSASCALGTSSVVVSSGARTETLDHAGAQLALGDLDGDGTAEIVTSLDTREPGTDAVVVRSLLPKRGVKERFRVPVPNGVRALSVCPLRAAGMAPIVVSTGDELWVIR